MRSEEDILQDFNSLPTAPVLWLTTLLDTFSNDWRQHLGVTNDSVWNERVPSLWGFYPSLLTFHEYLQQQNLANDSNWKDIATAFKTYVLETPSTALGDLSTPTAITALVLVLLLLRTVKSVLLPLFSRLGTWTAKHTHGEEWIQTHGERIHKFGEYVFRLFYHSLISIYGVVYFHGKPWWAQPNGTITLFQGYPYHPIEPGMALYYLLQSAYNMDAMISLLEISFSVRWQWPQKHGCWRSPVLLGWSESVRGDFREMMIHHVVTNLLVIGSSAFRLTRIGSMVFLVHDLSDVPVDLSKLANFVKWKYTTLACFLTMVGVWLMTRLYVLPFVIYNAILTQSHWVCSDIVPVSSYAVYRHFFYVLVFVLILLHAIWFLMFLQIFATFVRKNECHDLSEHKNGEQQSPAKSNRKKTQ